MARDPVADLRRIAFLLERANEASYRVKAFRNAAVTVAELSPGELRRRLDEGSERRNALDYVRGRGVEQG